MAQEKYVAYVGTYTHENSVGIHIYDVDVTKGYMKERKVVPINNPSDLVVSRNRKFLYSIADEGVEAFKILKDGDLEPINEQWIGGMRGCYVEVDDENRYLFVGGHHDGRVTMMRLNEDGSIGDIADGIFHKGIHSPCSGTATDTTYEVVEHLGSLFGMEYLRVELDGIEIFFTVFCGCHRAVCSMCYDFKTRCCL